MVSKRAAFAAAILSAICLNGAAAQPRCPEGTAVDGSCANPALASAMRQSAIIASQPKISYTAPLNLPRDDAFFPRIFQRYEYLNLFASPAPRPGGNPANPATMP